MQIWPGFEKNIYGVVFILVSSNELRALET